MLINKKLQQHIIDLAKKDQELRKKDALQKPKKNIRRLEKKYGNGTIKP